MGILDRLFKRVKKEEVINNQENIENQKITDNSFNERIKVSDEERNNQINKNQIMEDKKIQRENQLKFVFKQLACSNNYISNEDMEMQIQKHGYGNIELNELDIEVLKSYNRYYKGENITKEDIDYLNEDTDRIVGLIEYTEKCAKEQATLLGYSDAKGFIEVNGKLQEYMQIEQEKMLEGQEISE
ncbi:MAG: hypothetical protein E7311_02665 [Clostridiales bacterium]|nr:hypothetical protein [Clostridiales bacterium]